MADHPCHPPTLTVTGATLRPLREGDADAIHAYLSDPEVTALTAYPAVTPALAEAIIARSINRWAAGEPAKWGIVQPGDDRVVGTCGFNDYSAAHRWAELAYDLARPLWGAGLMRRAVAAVMEWAFRSDVVDRVHAYVRVDNRRSARLLERLGFVREGCLRSFRICRGDPHDYFVYSLLRAEWEAVA